MRRAIGLPVLLLVVIAGSLRGLDPHVELSQYAKRHWQVEQGLPQNYVTSLAQSADGHLYVGSSGGVSRFDGITFQPVVLDEQTRVSREWVNGLAFLPDGSLLISSRDSGAFLHAHGRTHRLPHAPRGASTVAAGRRGDLLLAGGPGGAWRARAANGAGQKVTVQRIARQGGGDLSWQGALELPDGRVLICSTSGLLSMQGGEEALWLPVRPPWGRALSLTLGAGGVVYAGTDTGLFRLAKDGRSASAIAGVKGPVVGVIEDRHGVVWAATWGQGIYRVVGADGTPRVEAWTMADGLPDDFVHTLLEDREGNLWIGSRAGLSRWSSTAVVPFGPPEGLDASFVSVVAGDRNADGELWIGTWRQGVHRYVPGRAGGRGQFVRLPVGFAESSTLLRSIAVARDGTVWLSAWHELLRMRGAARTEFFAQDLGFDPSVRALLEDRQGVLWMATTTGLVGYPGGTMSAEAHRELPGWSIECLLEARDGSLWIGAQQGLAVRRGNAMRLVRGLPHPAVSVLFEDSAGHVWAATPANGLVRVDTAEAQTVDERDGLPALPVLGVLEDASQRLWFSTPAGLYVVGRDALAAAAGGGDAKLSPIAFGADDGLRSIQFQGVGTPSAWQDASGHLWFPTVRGLVRARPELLSKPTAPRVLLGEWESQGRSHTLRFGADRLHGAERVEFRYRLPGLQGEWIYLGTQRSLRLEAIPAGEHRVEVAARYNGSAWSLPAGTLLRQPPRWFETGPFYVATLCALLLLVWLLYRWRMARMRARFALVTEERNRIGREWHDTLLAGFSAISWQLESAVAQLPPDGQQARNAIGVAADMLRHYRKEARQVIWDLRHSAPERESLPDALERTLAEVFRNSGVRVEVQHTGDPQRIPAPVAQCLLRICQEAAFNCLQHARASQFCIHLDVAENAVRAQMRDDGAGFDPAMPRAGHFGLAIMRERAVHAGGSLVLNAAPGQGVCLCATLPLRTQ